MKFLLGTKAYMTQVWDDEGVAVPSTVLWAGPMTVTAIKTNEQDGYQAVQVGFGKRNEKNVAKAQQGQWKDLGLPAGASGFAHVQEFRVKDPESYEVGQTIDASHFEVGDEINISGLTKGKGFQGGVKRHNFSGGPRTHGNKHHERAPGSIGATDPARVFKGTKMAGRMGNNRVTVKNLKVVQVDADNGAVLVSGAVPGAKGALLELRG